MTGKTKVLLTLATLGLAVLPVIIWAKLSFRPETAGQYNNLAKCLAEKKAVMYGAYWCSHCQAVKKEFGQSWQYIKYVECSVTGSQEQAPACKEAGIKSYPTWVLSDGERLEGQVKITDLANKSGCQEAL
ncbi:MAG: thioredoxin domain-containing protein [Candidatus Beckwithbacteria bacterium]